MRGDGHAHTHMMQYSVTRTHKAMYKYTRGEVQYMGNYAWPYARKIL